MAMRALFTLAKEGLAVRSDKHNVTTARS
jgi:hypothetical protein